MCARLSWSCWRRVVSKRVRISCLLCAAVLLNSGCEIQPVKAWERGDLAREEMAWQPDALDAAYREHVYFSKEASSGGATVGGGGCGCN